MTDLRLSVKIMYRQPIRGVWPPRRDGRRYQGADRGFVDVAYEGGTLGDYAARFDNRDPQLLDKTEWARISHRAWAAVLWFAHKGRQAGDTFTTRRYQIELHDANIGGPDDGHLDPIA